MPAKPSYSQRLPQLLQALEAGTADWIDRREVEEGLGVSKTVAWRLLRRLGARDGPGNTLVLRRMEAIEGMKRMLAEGSLHELEIRRRSRLEQYLERMRAYVTANRTTIVADQGAVDLVNTRFQELPPNVTLTPRSLHIDFRNTEEFLQAFGAIVFALNNDYEAMQAFIGNRTGAD